MLFESDESGSAKEESGRRTRAKKFVVVLNPFVAFLNVSVSNVEPSDEAVTSRWPFPFVSSGTTLV
jgi:hypothetical protein